MKKLKLKRQYHLLTFLQQARNRGDMATVVCLQSQSSSCSVHYCQWKNLEVPDYSNKFLKVCVFSAEMAQHPHTYLAKGISL